MPAEHSILLTKSGVFRPAPARFSERRSTVLGLKPVDLGVWFILAPFDYILGAHVESNTSNDAVAVRIDQLKPAVVVYGICAPARFSRAKSYKFCSAPGSLLQS